MHAPTLPLSSGLTLPALVASAETPVQMRFLKFFAVAIRNRNTRRAYAHAAQEFLDWCDARSVKEVRPLHVADWVEDLYRARSAPTAEQRLAGVRHLFDWLVVGQVVLFNPASTLRGPAHSVRTGRTPVLDTRETRALLDAVDVSAEIGLRDRALIGLVYTFAQVGAALSMKREDVFVQGRRLWSRLHEKGGQAAQIAMPSSTRRVSPRLYLDLWDN